MIKRLDPVVFFGSGPLAAKSLELLSKDMVVEAVITKAPASHHKGIVPVAEVCKKLELPVYYANSKAELDKLFSSNTFHSRIGILIDFGIIVSRLVIDYFDKGIVNSHFSVLPEWRGADPITFALISGQKTTGVSLMLLVEAMDEGPLLDYGIVEIKPDSTGPSLSQELITLSHSLLVKDIPLYQSGEITPKTQSITGRDISYSRKLSKEDGIIDWTESAELIEHKIRAFIEWPKSRTSFNGVNVTITRAHVIKGSTQTAGLITVDNHQLIVDCSKDRLSIDRLKPDNKPEMDIKAFLAGYKAKLQD